MDSSEGRQRLREAIAGADHAVVLDVLATQPWPDDSLQLIGDGLLAALSARSVGGQDLARRCGEALRSRDWDGDQHLADVIEARLGTNKPQLPLQPVGVDLDQLAAALHANEWDSPGKLNLTTGEVWPPFDPDYTDIEDEEDDEGEEGDEDRWLEIRGQGSRPGYRDMETFVAHVPDQHTAELLDAALRRDRPFRRFKDTLAPWPDLLDDWYAFSDDRERGRARAWLADQGYAAVRP